MSRLVQDLKCPLLGLCTAVLLLTPAHAEPSDKHGGVRKAAQPFTVSMQIELQPRLEVDKKYLMPNEVAYSGDHFAIKAWSDNLVYLYIVEYSPDTWSSLLFPRAVAQPVPAGLPVRLPSDKSTYKLDNNPGEINLFVVGSKKPLDQATCELLRLRCPIEQSSSTTRGDDEGKKSNDDERKKSNDKDKKQEERKPEAGKKAITRDFRLKSDSVTHTISAESDGKGVAIIRFSFEHRSIP